MINAKMFAIVLVVGLITATAMSALVADRMKTVTVCKDARIGMDGGIGATLEFGGLNPHFLVNLFTQHYKSHDKFKSLDVKPDLKVAMPQAHTSIIGGAQAYVATDFKLTVSATKKQGTDRYPASLETHLDGKKVTVALVCTK